MNERSFILWAHLLSVGCGGLLTLHVTHAEEAQPPVTSPSRPGGEARTPAAPPSAPEVQKRFYVLVDYLPAALYEGEPLTACLRIENTTSKDAEVAVLAESLDRNQKVVRSSVEKILVKTCAFGSYQKDLALREVASVRFTLQTPQGDQAGPVVRLLQEQDPWPGFVVRNGRLTAAAGGAVLVPVAHRITRDDRRAYAPVKWALGLQDQDPGGPVERGFLLLPGCWGTPRREAQTAQDTGQIPEGKSSRREVEPSAQPERDFELLWSGRVPAHGVLGPYLPEGAPPILCAVGDALRALPRPAPDRVIILLPPEDLDIATDPRVYRIALEILLARLKAMGIRQTVLVPPLRFGVPEKRRKLLLEEIREAAQIYAARVVNWEDELDEKNWRLDPETSGVYGRKPHPESLKKIGQKLNGLLP